MVMVFWAVIGLTSLVLSVAFLPRLVKDWIWNPWHLILACRKQGIPGFPYIPFVSQLPQISKVNDGLMVIFREMLLSYQIDVVRSHHPLLSKA